LALNSKEAKEELARTSLDVLVRLLDMEQPDQRDMAHSILRKVSGKDFAANDLAAWANWKTTQLKNRELSRKP
jgi:hypothetical protein